MGFEARLQGPSYRGFESSFLFAVNQEGSLSMTLCDSRTKFRATFDMMESDIPKVVAFHDICELMAETQMLLEHPIDPSEPLSKTVDTGFEIEYSNFRIDVQTHVQFSKKPPVKIQLYADQSYLTMVRVTHEQLDQFCKELQEVIRRYTQGSS